MGQIRYSITYYTDNAGEWRWHVVHTNGQIVGASSEGFSSEAEARANARRVRDALHLVTLGDDVE